MRRGRGRGVLSTSTMQRDPRWRRARRVRRRHGESGWVCRALAQSAEPARRALHMPRRPPMQAYAVGFICAVRVAVPLPPSGGAASTSGSDTTTSTARDGGGGAVVATVVVAADCSPLARPCLSHVACRFYLRRNLGDAPWEQVGTGMAKGAGGRLPPRVECDMAHAVRALCTCPPCALLLGLAPCACAPSASRRAVRCDN